MRQHALSANVAIPHRKQRTSSGVWVVAYTGWKDYPSRMGGGLTTIRTSTGNKGVIMGARVVVVRPTPTRFPANMHCMPSPSLHSISSFTARWYLLMWYSEGQTDDNFVPWYVVASMCPRIKKSPAQLAPASFWICNNFRKWCELFYVSVSICIAPQISLWKIFDALTYPLSLAPGK